jgi:hypothetical protein
MTWKVHDHGKVTFERDELTDAFGEMTAVPWCLVPTAPTPISPDGSHTIYRYGPRSRLSL